MKKHFYIPKKERLGFLTLATVIVLSHNIHYLYTPTWNKKHDLADIPTRPTKGSSDKALNEITRVDNVVKVRDHLRDNQVKKKLRKNEQPIKSYPNQTSGKSPILGSKEIKKESIAQDAQFSEHMNYVKMISNREPVDLNSATEAELRSIGIPRFVSQNVVKYRSKGGKFYQKSDILKIYGMDSVLYTNIEKGISIIEENGNLKNQKRYNELNDVRPSPLESPIELNQAKAEELTSLRGIGPVLSKRIVAYRDQLGGFYSIDQISEVYGLPTETFDQIKNSISVRHEIKKIFPPGMNFKDVLSHPYIDFETTKLLKNIPIAEFELTVKKYFDTGAIDKRLLPYLHLSDPEISS